MLSDFMTEHRDALIAMAASRVRKLRRASPAVERTRQKNLSMLFDSVLSALRAHEAEGSESAPRRAEGAHICGEQVMFDIDELMFQYESLCHSVNEAAKQQGIMIPLAAQQSLNTALDGCIARTVTEWEQEKRKSRGTSAVPRLRFVANEIRTALHNAGLGFQAVRSGRVPARGATADAIERSLARLGTLTENLLTEVRIAERLQAKEARLPIQKLLDESLSRISADAGEKEIGISVETDRSLEIEGDPDLLITALTNLLQNAVKFTRPGGSVSVRANAKPQGQVVIEIEGACAGLPADVVRRPFISFAHTGPHPSGLGLSLVMAHQVVDAHGGAIEVKDLPGRGCVFVVEMPSSAPARELPV